MITPQDAETLANKTIEEFVSKCDCRNEQDVANVLTKLASMCGLGMCAVVGQEEAVARLHGTTQHIANGQHSASWSKKTLQ